MKKIILLSVICLITIQAYTQQHILPSFFRDTANLYGYGYTADFSYNDTISSLLFTGAMNGYLMLLKKQGELPMYMYIAEDINVLLKT